MKIQSKYTLLTLLTLVGLILSITSSAIASPIFFTNQSEDSNDAMISSIDYLQSQMNPDGGIRWMDETSSVAVTVRVVIALAASGYFQNILISDEGNRPIDYLKTAGSEWVFQAELDEPSLNVARAGQLLTAIAAANENPEAFGIDSLNLVHATKSTFDPNTGIFGSAGPENVLDQVWAMIGLTSSNAGISADAAKWLASVQLPDGSWNDGFGSFLDTTPLGILALIASEAYTAESPEVQAALAFMKDNQQSDGGWKTEWDTLTNVNITGIMLQAITAVGQDPVMDWVTANGNPMDALTSLQQETGAFGGDYTNSYSTADVIIGLSNQPLYQLGRVRQMSRAFEYIFNQQDANGGWGSVGQTIDVMLAAAAADWNPNTIKNNDNSPLDFISDNMPSYIENGPDAVGKLILTAVLSEQDPTDFNNVNLIEEIMDTYSTENKAFGDPDNIWHQALALLGLNASDNEIPEGVMDTILSLQQDDGGWEYTPGFGTSPDNTSLAIQALLAAGYTPDDPVLTSAIQYLQTSQMDTGGWGDSSTTGFALMAINALGDSIEDWVTDIGKDPVSNLLSYQKANGAFVYNWDFSDDNLMSTATALLVLFEGDLIIEEGMYTSNNQAAILVSTGEDSPSVDCVQFNEETISGLELLDQSIFDYISQDGYISSIAGVGNREGETNYWSYWSWNGREWVFNNIGAADSIVFSGDVEAWYFTSWEVFPSLPPAFIPNIHQICNTIVLKNHTTQPFLNYNNLYPPLIIETDQTTISEGQPDTDSTQINENNSNTMSQEADQELEIAPRSSLPIILISTAGIVVVILIVIILRKKKQ